MKIFYFYQMKRTQYFFTQQKHDTSKSTTLRYNLTSVVHIAFGSQGLILSIFFSPIRKLLKWYP
jgi:hypothetical protein